MNGLYDRAAAANALEVLSAERQGNTISGFQLSRDTKENAWPHAYRVVSENDVKRLVFANTKRKEGHDMVEVVAHVQGILWRHDLPPFRNQSITPNRIKYIRQSISLTGLGTPTFDQSMRGVLDVYTLFSNHVPRDTLKACENCGTFGNYTSIDISNRYFSSAKNVAAEKSVNFTQDEDPHGILTRLVCPNYVHCESNIVEYFEQVTKPSGDIRYRKIPPVRFNIGDIVEAQFLFLLVPAGRNKHQMQMVLQSLTLLSNAYSQRAFVAEASKLLWPSMSASPVIIKRKTGYAEEEIASARTKLARMDIDKQGDEELMTGGKAEENCPE